MNTLAGAARLLAMSIIITVGFGSTGTAHGGSYLISGFEDEGDHALVHDGDDVVEVTSRLDGEVSHSGSSSLRINHLLPAGGGGYSIVFEDFNALEFPSDAWALEFHLRAATAQNLRLQFRVVEHSGEPWEVTLPYSIPDEVADEWRRVAVPFAWFSLISWQRRNGRLDLEDLATITIEVRAGGNEDQADGLWMDTLKVISSEHVVTVHDERPEGFHPLVLEGVFDSDAIAYLENPLDGDFHTGEWEHRSLPAEHFPQEDLAQLGEIPFRMPPLSDGENNNIRSNGQSVSGFQSGGYSAVFVLASGKFGDQTGDLVFHYEDGSRESRALKISDWSMRPQFEEEIGVLLPYAYRRNRIDRDREPRLFIQSVAIDSSRSLKSITLPVNDYLKIFGMTLFDGEEPPGVGMMADAPLAELDPRYFMPEMEAVNFLDAKATEVGVLGGYVRHRMGSHVLEIPTLNGFLAYTADARELPHSRLHWHRYQNRNRGYTLGGIHVSSTSENPAVIDLLDGTCVVYSMEVGRMVGEEEMSETLRVYHSRAWPAALHEIEGPAFSWLDDQRGNDLHLTIPIEGGHETFEHSAGMAFPIPVEPWILIWNSVPESLHRESSVEDVRSFGAPVLLVLERTPDRIHGTSQQFGGSVGIAFDYTDQAGRVAAMPLFGIRTIPGPTTLEWKDSGVPEEIITHARTWSRRLQRFPVGHHQAASLTNDGQRVTITDSFDWKELESDWEVEALPFTPLPPVAILAGRNGYPVELPMNIIDGGISAIHGPFIGLEDSQSSHTIPISPYVSSMVTLGDVSDLPLVDEARLKFADRLSNEIPDNLDGHLYISDISQDVARLRYQAPARLIMGDDPHREEFARRVVRNALDPQNLKLEKEPLSDQFFLMDHRFWAKDQPYDKEWSIGFILQGLWCHAYYHDDWEFIEENWNVISGLYNYYRIFFDWTTASTYTMTTGTGANSDGIRIAFDGMLAHARMAAAIGRTADHEEAVVRSARQQMSLYATWHAKRWAADHDYLISRYQHVREEDTEMLFSPDHLWSEFVTTNAAFPETDFFQTTHALYLFNLAHLMFLRDFGIHEDRLREWLFQRVPELHPDWCDGNVWPEFGGRYYGDSSVMALLVARSFLFPERWQELWNCLQMATDNTAVMEQWYSPEPLVPMVLASMITGHGPLVIIPVDTYSIGRNHFSAGELEQNVVLTSLIYRERELVLRPGAYRPLRVTINESQVEPVQSSTSDSWSVQLPSVQPGEQLDIMVYYEVME
ncbi:MAG: hypothetical protein JJU11_10140 [Candidatus Sumerlaeia bacterium]|nr:hypothetical protein [Candidatus Sumerlaeia bacterium]